MTNNEAGSVIHLILVAVVLFGALSYAFTNSTRTSWSFLKDAGEEAETTGALTRSNDVLAGLKRLHFRGCKDSEISYEGPPFDASTGSYNSNSPKDFSCHLYHIKGASIVYTSGSPGCIRVGDTCPDGTVFAGMTPDGGIPMFTTPADASGTYSWNNGSLMYVDALGLAECTIGSELACYSGEAGTQSLVGLGASPSPAPYHAAMYCNDLAAHGHDDWYLPSINELQIMYANNDSIGGFNTAGGFPASSYWSSSERSNSQAWSLGFDDGADEAPGKNNNAQVRCVRK